MKVHIDVRIEATQEGEVSAHITHEVSTHGALSDHEAASLVADEIADALSKAREAETEALDLSQRTGLNIKQLYHFYAVDTPDALLKELATHVTQLQAEYKPLIDAKHDKVAKQDGRAPRAG
jgi:hypothetical protein